MTISIGSVGATAASLLSTLTGDSASQPATNPAPATATTPNGAAAAKHGGHHGHHGGGSFADILGALTDPTATSTTPPTSSV
jgi:hypothetical protein